MRVAAAGAAAGGGPARRRDAGSSSPWPGPGSLNVTVGPGRPQPESVKYLIALPACLPECRAPGSLLSSESVISDIRPDDAPKLPRIEWQRMTAEVEVAVQRGIPPVIFVLGPRDQHFGTRRFRFVAAWLSGLVALALVLALTRSFNVSPISSLTDMLCCDGCCRTPLLAPKVSIKEPTRATILHLSGSTEIDYTSNGHRVPLHMETALNELDHIERHVKLGLPKYLQESAAQREADLVDHRFERDLEGTSRHHRSALAVRDSSSSSDSALPSTDPLTVKATLTEAVAEASKMERHLAKKDQEEQGQILTPSSRALSRDARDAEKEAAHVGHLSKT
jgi:hypothetical protein